MCPLVPMAMIRRRGDRQHGADRLDPEHGAMVGDELDHRGYVLRRSSSAWAKYANAFRRISFARFSSRTSRSSSFNRSRSLVVRPGRCPASRCACRTHFRSVSAVQPSFGATDYSTAHSEAWASRCSSTIRTARSRTSGENRLGRPIDPILPSNEVSEKSGTIHSATTRVAGRRPPDQGSECEGWPYLSTRTTPANNCGRSARVVLRQNSAEIAPLSRGALCRCEVAAPPQTDPGTDGRRVRCHPRASGGVVVDDVSRRASAKGVPDHDMFPGRDAHAGDDERVENNRRATAAGL